MTERSYRREPDRRRNTDDEVDERYARTFEGGAGYNYERGRYGYEDYPRSDEPEWRMRNREEGAPITQDYGSGRTGYANYTREPFYARPEYTHRSGESSRRGTGREESGFAYREPERRGYGRMGSSTGSYSEDRERRYGSDREEYYGESSGRERSRGTGGREERGFFERAGDEVRSWFGDDQAEMRRRQDERRDYGRQESRSSNYNDSMWGGGYRQEMRAGNFTGRGPRGYRRSDERITEDINERLTQHPQIDAVEIEVSVENGEVTLRGTVPNRQAKHLAEDIAESVSGVKDVTNLLRVNRGEHDQQRLGNQQSQPGEGEQQTQPRTRTATS